MHRSHAISAAVLVVFVVAVECGDFKKDAAKVIGKPVRCVDLDGHSDLTYVDITPTETTFSGDGHTVTISFTYTSKAKLTGTGIIKIPDTYNVQNLSADKCDRLTGGLSGLHNYRQDMANKLVAIMQK